MSYIQLVSPNLSVSGRSGYCLEMQENVWGALHQYDYAEQAWNSSSADNHPLEPPPNVCVPLYWTYFDTADNAEYGHVATWVPGRGVFSSTFNTAIGSEWYPSVQAMTDRINKIPRANGRYLGWSEVISNVRVIQGEDMWNITKAQENAIYQLKMKDFPGDGYNGYAGNPATQENVDAMIKKIQELPEPPAAVPTVVPIPDPNSVVVSKDGLWASFKRFFGL